MHNKSIENMILKAARFGPFFTAGSATVIVLHAALYQLMKKGLLGRTDFYVMFVPVLLYFSVVVGLFILFIILCLRRSLSAVWYFISLLICSGGLVMALIELDGLMEVT